MMPSPDEVAAAIVAACRETGALPLDVAQGLDREGGIQIHRKQAISRARAYAGRALNLVCNRSDMDVPPAAIARMIGVNRPSWDSFFTSLEGRPLSWWDEAAFKRVVDAVMDCDPVEENTKTAPEVGQQEEKPLSDQCPAGGPLLPTPYKFGALPPVRKDEPTRQLIGRLEPRGFRPAPGTYARVLEDDAKDELDDDLGDDAPIFDRGNLGGSKPRAAPAIKSKRQMAEDLAEAVRNTAAQTPPPEEER